MSMPPLFGAEQITSTGAVQPTESAARDSEATPTSAVDAGPRGGQTQSLYRKYRPQTFHVAEMVGQEPIVRTLRNAIVLGRVAHAYLFCGPRGTGKTTTARLLAKAVNCLDPDPSQRPCNRCESCRAIATGSATDVIEIDAASNRGIDDIRELRERVRYAPTQLRSKFYIVDEAHQITGAAANAFLKTLEEPPGHTKFILATTDPEELLPTIVSRCQRFDFRRIDVDAIVARLRTVAGAESLQVDDDALRVIARHATGSLRDALGLLDQLAVFGELDGAAGVRTIDVAAVRALLGVSRNDRVETLVSALAERDPSLALGTVNAAVEAGADPRQFNRQLVAYLRVLLHQRAGGSPDADERARDLAGRFDLLELAQMSRLFSEVDYKIRHSSYGQLPFEVALVEAILRRAPIARAAADQREGAPPDEPPASATRSRSIDTPEAGSPPADLLAKPATTALRDRLRGQVSEQDRPPHSQPPSDGMSAAVAKPRIAEVVKDVAPAGRVSVPGDGITVDQLADLWPKIRLDVKAINRRIEALLASIDPIAVDGDQITLAAAYDFHRNRLNSDEVRPIIEGVVGRLVGRSVRICCVLRGEEVAATGSGPVAGSNGTSALKANTAGDRGQAPVDSPPPLEATAALDERRVQAAKNIFDAEELTT